MKIGVIGTGYWGPNIVRNLILLNQDVTIYDINQTNLQKTLQRFQECKTAKSLEDILQNPEIFAVAIAVPLKTHYELVFKALQAGKHVYVEKPLCYSIHEADSIKDQIREKILMVGHITLYTSSIVKINEIITNEFLLEYINKSWWQFLTQEERLEMAEITENSIIPVASVNLNRAPYTSSF